MSGAAAQKIDRAQIGVAFASGFFIWADIASRNAAHAGGGTPKRRYLELRPPASCTDHRVHQISHTHQPYGSAEQLLAPTDWLPALLRTAKPHEGTDVSTDAMAIR